MNRANLLICVAVAIVVVTIWALVNRPEVEPPWPTKVQGFSFQPMRAWHNPMKHDLPTTDEVQQDIELLKGKTNAIRTYSVEGVLAEIPRLAHEHGLNVTLGAWLDGDLETNEEQIETVIRVAKANYRNVIRVIVGNEAIFRGDLTVTQLNGYIERVQKALAIPVSTAEPYHIWYKHRQLATHVDFIAAHMLPYWEGIHLDRAVDQVIGNYNLLVATYPELPVVIAEVGWPSNGRTRQEAVASAANEATFLRRFLQQAEDLGLVYYVLEAFDQPWKAKATEGAVGAYWGVYNADRDPKFPFTSPIVYVPEWHILAGISVLIAAITFMVLLIDNRRLRAKGSGFLASIAFGAASGATWIVYSYTRQYLTVSTVLIGVLMVIGLIGVAIVLLAEAHEWAEALWGTMTRHQLQPVPVEDGQLPKVAIHVPAYNEPPQMLIETLNALAALDYPDYEVIVMDNNTRDPAVWKPVAEHCQRLGDHFRFYHEEQLAGFKAGALNYALCRTSLDVEVIAVIDSDYVVKPSWLRDLAPHFLREEIAIVQAPQDYRDDRENLFKAMCYSEYQGFFSIGMMIRNERNAIIQHGTMTMVRKSVLDEVAGWAEWCITEDAELGLRIFELGGEALYVPESYGRGVMPDTFTDFKKQRFRWAYGAVQIMKYHRRALLSKSRSSLTYGQRYHFVAGWLPWVADAVNLLFTLAAVAWTVGMIHFPHKIDPPLLILSVVPLTFFVFKIAKMFYLYQYRVSSSTSQTVASAIAGLSLTHTIAKAILLGFVTSRLPFFRTPKRVAGSSFWYALQSAREEGLMALALLLGAGLLVHQQGLGTSDMLVWVLVLLVQSSPYLAALLMSFISAWPQLSARLVGGRALLPEVTAEN